MSIATDLKGSNLQPMPVIRSEMSRAMCILDGIIQGYDGNPPAATVNAEEARTGATTTSNTTTATATTTATPTTTTDTTTATTSKRNPSTTGEVNCTTSASSLTNDIDHADEEISAGCTKAFDQVDDYQLGGRGIYEESKPHSVDGSHFHFQDSPNVHHAHHAQHAHQHIYGNHNHNGPHHDVRPYTHSRSHDAHHALQEQSFYPPPSACATASAATANIPAAAATNTNTNTNAISNSHSKRNDRNWDAFLPSNRPTKRLQTAMADSAHPHFLQHQQHHQQHHQHQSAIYPTWERFPNYYYGSAPFANEPMPTANSSSSSNNFVAMQQSPYASITVGNNYAASHYSSNRSFFQPSPQRSRPDITMMSSQQQQQQQQNDTSTIPFEDFQYLFYPNQNAQSPSPSSHQEAPSQQPPFAAAAGSQFASRTFVSSASAAAVSAAFLPPTTDTWQVAAATQQSNDESRTSLVAATSKKQASKPTSASTEDPPQDDVDEKADNTKQESFLRPIHHEKWQRRFHDLLVFKQQHGHCLVPIAYEAVPTLPHWVKRQRNQYKKKIVGHETTLTDERQQILDNVGFVWDSHQALWTLRLRECHQFRIQHGHCSIPARYPPNNMLAVWAKCQRRQFRLHQKGVKSALTAKRIDDLNELGFVWDPLGLGLS